MEHKEHKDHGGHHHGHVHGHGKFDDAEKWAIKFERDDRDEFQKPNQVIEKIYIRLI